MSATTDAPQTRSMLRALSRRPRVCAAHPHPALEALRAGDLLFIRATARPFREVATATQSWTNHVGVAITDEHGRLMIAESTFPFAKLTAPARFLARSEHGRYALARLRTPLDPAQQHALAAAARRRLGIFYDTGFNLDSRRQFCSRFAREVVAEATGIALGEVACFATLLRRNPQASLAFWRCWYFGAIPWTRRTVTPASVLLSPELDIVMQAGTAHDPV